MRNWIISSSVMLVVNLLIDHTWTAYEFITATSLFAIYLDKVRIIND